MTRRDVLKFAAAAALSGSGSPAMAVIPHDPVTLVNSRPLLTVRLAIGPIQKLGGVPKGESTIFPITGGSFEGPRLRGKVLPGGADWTLLRPDEALELDLRILLETDDGARIYMTFQGLRHGSYFRSVARFETAAPKYLFLNQLLAVGSGEIRDGTPTHTFEEIL